MMKQLKTVRSFLSLENMAMSDEDDDLAVDSPRSDTKDDDV